MAMKSSFSSIFYSCEGIVRNIRAKEFVVEQVISEPFFDQTTRVRGAAHLKLCRL